MNYSGGVKEPRMQYPDLVRCLYRIGTIADDASVEFINDRLIIGGVDYDQEALIGELFDQYEFRGILESYLEDAAHVYSDFSDCGDKLSSRLGGHYVVLSNGKTEHKVPHYRVLPNVLSEELKIIHTAQEPGNHHDVLTKAGFMKIQESVVGIPYCENSKVNYSVYVHSEGVLAVCRDHDCRVYVMVANYRDDCYKGNWNVVARKGNIAALSCGFSSTLYDSLNYMFSMYTIRPLGCWGFGDIRCDRKIFYDMSPVHIKIPDMLSILESTGNYYGCMSEVSIEQLSEYAQMLSVYVCARWFLSNLYGKYISSVLIACQVAECIDNDGNLVGSPLYFMLLRAIVDNERQ